VKGMDALLARARAAHEALMVDSVRVYRPGEPVFDRATGSTVPGQETAIYGPAKGRVKPSALSTAEQAQAGEREIALARYEVALPWGVVLPDGVDRMLPGDLVEVTASPDTRLASLVLWVASVQFSATATAWRLIAEDRSSWGQT
jgi:hypothetical protein